MLHLCYIFQASGKIKLRVLWHQWTRNWTIRAVSSAASWIFWPSETAKRIAFLGRHKLTVLLCGHVCRATANMHWELSTTIWQMTTSFSAIWWDTARKIWHVFRVNRPLFRVVLLLPGEHADSDRSGRQRDQKRGFFRFSSHWSARGQETAVNHELAGDEREGVVSSVRRSGGRYQRRDWFLMASKCSKCNS